jgi:O-succinylbenzoic acid--CoA ligase
VNGSEWLAERARTNPDRPALVRNEESLSWGALDARVEETAGRLSRLGVRPGERVALLAGTTIAAAAVIHALPRIGAILVPLSARLSPEEAAWQAADCRAGAFLYESEAHPAVARMAAGVPDARRAALAHPLPGDPRLDDLPPAAFDRIAPSPDDLHTIVYTSGTTGRPRGVLLTFANHFASAAGARERLGLRPEDRWLACMPLYHMGGLSILLRAVLCGFTVVLQDVFDERRVIDAIAKERITLLSLVPIMLRRILEADPDRKADLSSLRVVLLGGAPLPDDLIDEALRRGLPIAPTYGLTECASQVATLPPDELREGAGTVGRPLPGVKLRMLRDDGTEAAAEEVGEIAVRGAIVSPGTLSDPDARRDGWLRTGDLGRIDARGRLVVVGRKNEMIISGGENIHPAEVERVLLAHPDVTEAAVAGSPDAHWGQRVVAAVVPRTGARVTPEDLAAHCRANLAGYKIPRAIVFVRALPRNALGKVLRREIPGLVE